MIAERLKLETKSEHQALEKLLIPQIKRTTTVGEYITVLSLFYGYYKPLEDKIAQYITTDYLPDMRSRRKAGWLLDDMKHFGADTTQLPLADKLPQITNQAQALGALYVMEGSALGGKIIKKMLQGSMGNESDNGYYFFNGYGEQTGHLWSVFLDAANRYVDETHLDEDIINAANETFLLFKQFIESRVAV